jgi:saccharopine dehydrogenase-like NADP-dependent oxidoreductase
LYELQAVEELKTKLQGFKDLYLAQMQSFHTAVHAHEAVSTSTFKALDSTVTAHPAVLEQVCVLGCESLQVTEVKQFKERWNEYWTFDWSIC